MHVHLETVRMVLRRFTVDDVDALVALDSDPLVRRYVEDGEPVTPAAAIDAITQWIEQYERSDVFGFWAAVERETGQFLGWFHLRPREPNRPDEPELGYRLVSSSWGKGYATEGARALIDRGFESPEVSCIVAETMAVHTASRRVMEKVGMRHVRDFHADWPVHIPGDEHGDVEYAITRDDWESARHTREHHEAG